MRHTNSARFAFFPVLLLAFASLLSAQERTRDPFAGDAHLNLGLVSGRSLPVENSFLSLFSALGPKERGDEPSTSYVMGRVTDFGGRSVRGARISLFDIDSEDVRHISTNAFGYYRIHGLRVGNSYLISVNHRRYIFVLGSISFTVEDGPIGIDFQAEEMP